jgi:hypothetical protein
MMNSSFESTKPRRPIGALVITSLLAVGAPLAIAASPADALSSTCSAWKTTIPRTGIDDNYASASCSAIGATTKVRAKLDVTADSDAHSAWFTALNKTYSSPTTSCWWGCSATTERAAR